MYGIIYLLYLEQFECARQYQYFYFLISEYLTSVHLYKHRISWHQNHVTRRRSTCHVTTCRKSVSLCNASLEFCFEIKGAWRNRNVMLANKQLMVANKQKCIFHKSHLFLISCLRISNKNLLYFQIITASVQVGEDELTILGPYTLSFRYLLA